MAIFIVLLALLLRLDYFHSATLFLYTRQNLTCGNQNKDIQKRYKLVCNYKTRDIEKKFGKKLVQLEKNNSTSINSLVPLRN